MNITKRKISYCAGIETKAQVGMIYFTCWCINMTVHEHGNGLVESRWQLANAEVDDDQRHSTLLLGSLLLGRLLEGLDTCGDEQLEVES